MGGVRHKLLLQAHGPRDGLYCPAGKKKGKAQKYQPDRRAGQAAIAQQSVPHDIPVGGIREHQQMAGRLLHPEVSQLIAVQDAVIRFRRHAQECQPLQIPGSGKRIVCAIPHDDLAVLRYQHGKIGEPHLGNRIEDQPFSRLFHGPFQNQPAFLISPALQHTNQRGKGDPDHRRHDEHVIDDKFSPQPADFLHASSLSAAGAGGLAGRGQVRAPSRRSAF